MVPSSNIPKFAFGTAFEIGNEGAGKMSARDFNSLLRRAIELGCRHIDCAPLYGTQELVGQVLEHAMQTIPRSEFFVTSKLPVNMMREEFIEKSLKHILKELKLTYLDLFLIHAPFSTKHIRDNEFYPLDDDGNLLIDEQGGLLESCWQKLVDLKQKGLCRFVGLSNINLTQLDRMNTIHQVDVVQNEYHLYNQDRAFFDHCKNLDVHFEAYAAFGCPPRAKLNNNPTFMNDLVVKRIAAENNLSEAEVIIQWLHRKPLSYVTRSDNPAQLDENFKATSKLSLTINEMIELDCLNENARLYNYDNYTGIAEHREYPFK